jgi:mRNA-degrading endonuclease RelE of RelBE toxin-antitoxin system
VKSHMTPRFRMLLASLPEDVRRQAREAYRLFSENPRHPSLRFKRVREDNPTHSVRIGARYRALGYFEGDTIVWVWIGTHAEYDRLLAQR